LVREVVPGGCAKKEDLSAEALGELEKRVETGERSI